MNLGTGTWRSKGNRSPRHPKTHHTSRKCVQIGGRDDCPHNSAAFSRRAHDLLTGKQSRESSRDKRVFPPQKGSQNHPGDLPHGISTIRRGVRVSWGALCSVAPCRSVTNANTPTLARPSRHGENRPYPIVAWTQKPEHAQNTSGHSGELLENFNGKAAEPRPSTQRIGCQTGRSG